jgi:hypothetical protein
LQNIGTQIFPLLRGVKNQKQLTLYKSWAAYRDSTEGKRAKKTFSSWFTGLVGTKSRAKRNANNVNKALAALKNKQS